MTYIVEEARARLLAHDEGYRVHVGCGGEVDARTMLCAQCDEAIGVGQFAHPDDLSDAAADDVRALVVELERTRAELAAARAAMPTDEERDVLDTLYRATVERVTGGGTFPATARAEDELAKARAWLARLDAAKGVR